MTDKKPTPIRSKRTTKPPEPITFPAPKQELPQPPQETQRLAYVPAYQLHPSPLEGAELRNFVANCIGKTIYRALDVPEAEIITMGEAQFQAFCRSVLEDEEA